MKLSVQLVTWNGEKYLPALFDSLKSQSFIDWELLILDNGSTDRSVEFINEQKDKIGVPVRIFIKNKNIGFAPAHSFLFRESSSPYVAVINQDLILETEVFEKLTNYLDKNPKVGSVSPRLLRMQNGTKTTIIDSLGLQIRKNRQVVDISAGKNFQNEVFEQSPVHDVFGVSAAIAIYSRQAVGAVCRPGELFDESYFSYQEDVDLAWKLQLGGFGSAVLTGISAYHERGIKEPEDKSLLGRFKNKKKQPFYIRYNSYRNHLATIYKNEQWPNFILDFFLIFWYEGLKFKYNFWFDREILKGIRDLWNRREELKAERKRIKSITRESWKNLGRWWA
ncbi:MAG: glycosyltransferase family 2 protein [Patescibacteria group bacterium]|jgi:GT2 family glycosyltransferase